MAENHDLGFHTKRIRLLRKLLPLLALALMAVLLLVLGLASNTDMRRAAPDDETLNDRLVITNPDFKGRLRDGRRFSLMATEGRQKTNGQVVMQAPNMLINGDTPEATTGLISDRADYHPLDAKANLIGNVAAKDALGNVLNSQAMQADLAEGVLRASAVTMTGPSGRIAAEALTADTKTQHYQFQQAVMRLKEPGK